MTKETDNRTTPPRKGWRRAAKIMVWAVIIAVVVAFTAMASLLRFFTPERLTPIVEKLATDNLNAHVEIGRAELVFWSTFPELNVKVDNIKVISESLSSLNDKSFAALPSDADSLLSVDKFSGGINILGLIRGEIKLHDVVIDGPEVNLLAVNDSVNNYSILPPSSPDKPSSPIPNISINKFRIVNARRISYRSLADSTHFTVQLHDMDLASADIPHYQLQIDTDISSPVLNQYDLSNMQIGVDGAINWDGKNPYTLSLSPLRVEAEGVDVTMSTTVDFRDSLRVDNMDVDINHIDINRIRSHAPEPLRSKLSEIDTDMSVNLSLRLLEPFVVSKEYRLPSLEACLNIPDCHFYWGDIHFNEANCDITATMPDGMPKNMAVTITALKIDGRAMDIELSGRLSDLLDDAKFDGKFNGAIDFGAMPAKVRKLIPGRLTGLVNGNTDLKLRLGDLDRSRFYRIYADGNITMRNLRFNSFDSLTNLYSRVTRMEFGSSRTVNSSAGTRVDSMLVVTVNTDSLNFDNISHHFGVSDFTGSFASSNTKTSADTTKINPFGGKITFSQFRYRSDADSVRLTVSNASGLASFRQYKGDIHLPQIGLNIAMERSRVTSREFRSTLSDLNLQLNTHLRRSSRRAAETANSTENRSHRSSDSSENRSARPLTSQQLDSLGVETIDFNIDRTIRDIFRKWDGKGVLTARRGTVRMAGIPLRTQVRNVNLDFTADSVSLNSLSATMGRSDFKVKGTIANMRGAMNRRRPEPLRLSFDVNSDTININQIVQSIARKDNFADDELSDDDWAEDETIKLDRDLDIDSVSKTLLIPVNINANLRVKANDVIYSNLDLKDFHGDVLINRGILQLHNISARNSAGSLAFSALYRAPVPSDISLGLGLVLNDFQLDRMADLIPDIAKIVPMLDTFKGIVTARLAATVDVKENMDLDMPTLRGALNITGDSLAVEDNKAMRTVAKWLMFKNKRITRIDSIDVNAIVRDNTLQVYPFMVNIDRYRLAVMGHNSITGNLDYHVAVLKSPIPFKFGVNIKGTVDKPKIRFGGAKLKPDMITHRDAVADTLRINLIKEMNTVFTRGLEAARLGPLNVQGDSLPAVAEPPEPTITASDSLMLINAGLIDSPIHNIQPATRL